MQIDQGIDQNEWGQWDIHTLAEKNAIPCQVHVNIFPVTDSESEPHLFALMIMFLLLAMILLQTW